jgi:S-adenosylmethionine synthetase
MFLVEPYRRTSVAEQLVAIVERKGTGHPDYLCDSMMEAISIALSKEYMLKRKKRFALHLVLY